MSEVCMRCGKKEVDKRGLCKTCARSFQYMYAYRCPRGHEWFSVLKMSVRCPCCYENNITLIAEAE